MTEFKIYSNAYEDANLNLDDSVRKLFIDFDSIADDGKIIGASFGGFNSMEKASGILLVVDNDVFDHIENLRFEFVDNKPRLFVIDEEQFIEDKKSVAEVNATSTDGGQVTGEWKPL